jgi:spermidine/putrescine transport system substrate-binding protein
MAMPLLSCKKREAGTIRVLNWQHYGTDEPWALQAFYEKTGITVLHEYFMSEDDMIQKLRANPGRYDVVRVGCARNRPLYDAHLLQPIDMDKISNADDLIPAFRNSDRLIHDGQVYGLAWVWGFTGLAYNNAQITSAVDSLVALWDPAHHGMVAFRDDATEAIGIAALLLNQDVNHPADLNAVKDKLLALKGQIALLFTAEDRWDQQFATGRFAISPYWSGAAAYARTKLHLPLGFTVPKEGGIGWFDGLSIPVHAPNPAGAHRFIDYMIDPDFYIPWAQKIGAPASVNARANEKLPDGDVTREFHSNLDWISRLQFQAALSDDERKKYDDLWSDVRRQIVG